MILDSIDRLAECEAVVPGAREAAAWLSAQSPEQLLVEGNPTVEIRGKALRVMLLSEPLKPQAAARWEAHRRCTDIQVLLRGTQTGAGEGFGWCPLRPELAVSEPYDAQRDVVFYEAAAPASDLWFELNPGQFVIFGPEDVHAPCLGTPGETVRKVVFKIEADASA